MFQNCIFCLNLCRNVFPSAGAGQNWTGDPNITGFGTERTSGDDLNVE